MAAIPSPPWAIRVAQSLRRGGLARGRGRRSMVTASAVEGSNVNSFEIVYKSKISKARVGVIHTQHGPIHTPGYVPVGTNGTVKALDSRQLDAAGVQLMFVNTYHMMLHPGADVVAGAGGLHNFMNRQGPLITDSGGFQVFSLKHRGVEFEGGKEGRGVDAGAGGGGAKGGGGEIKRRGASRYDETNLVLKVSEEGVLFKSYRDGSRHMLSPETSVAAQKALGADIIVPLDELPPYHVSREVLEESVHRSHRWMARSLEAHRADERGQMMYGIVHGGVDEELRRMSARYVSGLGFDGYAVGGSVGKDRGDLVRMLGWVMDELPPERPVHLLGVADEESIDLCAPLGIDTFDSCYATKLARHGQIMTGGGRVRLGSGSHVSSYVPPDSDCGCHTCSNYTRAYLHHLIKANEPTAAMLLTLHNVHWMVQRMAALRERILKGEV